MSRRTALAVGLPAALAAAAIAIPLAGRVVGNDYLLDRNLLPAWLPLAVFVAAGLGAGAGAVGRIVLVGICVMFVVLDVRAAEWNGLQRDDWRGASDRLGRAHRDRVIVVAPGWASPTLRLYRPRLGSLLSTASVSEVDTVEYEGFTGGAGFVHVDPPSPEFHPVESATIQRFRITRYRASHPVPVQPPIKRTFSSSWKFIEPGP